MLLNAVIIVLRETLEAGILISLLLTVAHRINLANHWLYKSLTLGFVFAVFYALQLGKISQWFDYTGQEIVNASIQYALYIFLFLLILIINSRAIPVKILSPLLILTVILAMAREGSEIIIFFSGYLQGDNIIIRALTSGFIGLTIGLSAGVLVYFIIMAIPETIARNIQLVVLSFIAAGMVAQATQLLIQSDWINATLPLWNSNNILDERSMIGQLAYAILGYESTPSAIEVTLYFSALLIIPVSLYIQNVRNNGYEIKS